MKNFFLQNKSNPWFWLFLILIIGLGIFAANHEFNRGQFRR